MYFVCIMNEIFRIDQSSFSEVEDLILLIFFFRVFRVFRGLNCNEKNGSLSTHKCFLPNHQNRVVIHVRLPGVKFLNFQGNRPHYIFRAFFPQLF